MLDQERVDGDPVPLGDGGPEGGLRLLGGLRPDHAEPVRDPVDVGVDRHPRDPVPEHEHAVRGLGADAWERRQLLEGLGDDAPEPLEDLPRRRPDRPRLGVVEIDLANPGLDPPNRRLRKARRIREACEESRRRGVGALVPRPLGEDRADQYLERVLGMVAEVRDPPVAGVIERAEPVEERLPVERRVPRHRCTTSGDPTPGSERSGSSAGRPSTSAISSPTR